MSIHRTPVQPPMPATPNLLAGNGGHGETLPVVATERKSVLLAMADRYGMEATAFEATVMATCFPPSRDQRPPNKAEFAAFLLVAHEYKLNPVTREIFGFRNKSGAIVPIVPVDGWVHLVNANPYANGFKFEDELDEQGNLIAVTCVMYRKDREHAGEVTEYMDECKRDTEPWKRWPKRMLRHKAFIQCARYTFGFAGIVDPDEAERMIDVTPTQAEPPSPPMPPAPEAHSPGQDIAMETLSEILEKEAAATPPTSSPPMPPMPPEPAKTEGNGKKAKAKAKPPTGAEEIWFHEIQAAVAACQTQEALQAVLDNQIIAAKSAGMIEAEAFNKAQRLVLTRLAAIKLQEQPQ